MKPPPGYWVDWYAAKADCAVDPAHKIETAAIAANKRTYDPVFILLH